MSDTTRARPVLAPPEYVTPPSACHVPPGSHDRTFQHDEGLPPLPVPSLEQTLALYLDSVKPHLTDDELERTTAVVERFGNGVAKHLHDRLLQRAAQRRNWLEDWWLNEAYLRVRVPLAPYCNPGEIGVCTDHYWPPLSGTQLERCALHMHLQSKIWLAFRREEIALEGRGPTKFTMHQLRNSLNSVQVPGEHIDDLQTYFKTEREGPGYSHVIVLCNGHVCRLEMFTSSGRHHTPPEILQQLRAVKRQCTEQGKGPCVGALTALPRSEWFKLRQHLIKLDDVNKAYLDQISTALGCYCLDDTLSPYNDATGFEASISGDVTSRWFDKSVNYIVCNNGVITSSSAHSPADGMAMITVNRLIQSYVYQGKGKWTGSSEAVELPRMDRLDFNVDDEIIQGVQDAKVLFKAGVENVSFHVPTFMIFGKDLLKVLRFHPDTFVQLALQLAFYKLHGKPAPTYETATTRQFYHGRTETVRSCTPEALTWCRAMLDESKTKTERFDLLKRAHDKHNWLMLECCNARGCDRHLMGLRMIALEAGEPEPEIYRDPAWKKSGGDGTFILSTSLSGYSLAMGGMPPMVENGYGVFYRIHDSKITMILTSFKSCTETNEKDLYGCVATSFLEMRDLIVESTMTSANL